MPDLISEQEILNRTLDRTNNALRQRGTPSLNYPVNGRKTIASSATPEALSAGSFSIRGLVIIPLSSNTGSVYVGSSAVATTTGLQLIPSHPGLGLEVDDLAKVYVIPAVNGEGVTFGGIYD